MDCLKNLTACMGCTKKHAKCSWKEVREPELRMTQPPPENDTTHSDIEMGGYPVAIMRQNMASPASASPSTSVGSVGGHTTEARLGGPDANAGHITPGQAHAELPRPEGRLSVSGIPDMRREDRLRESEHHSSHGHMHEHQPSHGQLHERHEPEPAHPVHPERHAEQPHQSDLQSLVA